MSLTTSIDVIPNEQLFELESNSKLVQALEQLICTPCLYGFYELNNDEDYDEYLEITEDLDDSIVKQLTIILKQAYSSLPTPTPQSYFENTYDLHEAALRKGLVVQNVAKPDEVIELLLNAEVWLFSEDIRILSYEKVQMLHKVLETVDVNALAPFYKWKTHSPRQEWIKNVKSQMQDLFNAIDYAANHEASLLYYFC